MVPHTQVAVSTGTKLATGTVGVTAGIGQANLWVYQISTDGVNFTAPNWPAVTIEAQKGKKLNVTYENKLLQPDGVTPLQYSDVGLIVDQTLHWAAPTGMDMKNLKPYVGPVPAVVHLHGGEVPPQSDGGPDAWFTPNNALTGHAFNPAPYLYPNTQEAATLWYHDHALGATRLNVYAGMAGFYLLRDVNEDGLGLPGFAGDGMVQQVDPVTNATVGSPYLPEIEIAIQDRMFDNTGKLFFPNLPTNPLDHPFWTPEFVGDVITVNGKTWPYLSVAPRKYRFRLLNGSNARFYNLSFPKGGPTITQIGTDGGFLDAPVILGNGPLLLAPGERADVVIDFAPFATIAKVKGKTTYQSFILNNDARAPYPGGKTVNGTTTGRIMQFVVNGSLVGTDVSNVPANLRPIQPLVKLTDFVGAPTPGVPVVRTRQLTLNEVMGAGGPLEVLVNNTKWTGLSTGTPAVRTDFKPVTSGTNTTYYSETMDEGSTEIWQIINLTADAHPMHVHLVQLQLVSRQPFNVKAYNAVYNAAFPGGLFVGGFGPPLNYNADQKLAGEAISTIGGNPNVKLSLLAPARGANLNEQGWKDTFVMMPGEVTTVIARWAPTDKPATDAASTLWFPFNPNGGHGYVWHCHIVDHEDNEMMRPYDVMPNPDAVRPPITSIASQGQTAEIQASKEGIVGQPGTFELSQNYPNPFNPSTEIRFALPEASHVSLKIYNGLGQEVKTLIDADAPAGYHTVRLDARGLSSGIYFYRIQAGSFVEVKSMTLMK